MDCPILGNSDTHMLFLNSSKDKATLYSLIQFSVLGKNDAISNIVKKQHLLLSTQMDTVFTQR